MLSGGTDTQAFRERIAKKTGGVVSARTIGTMLSAAGTGNPTLANIEAVALALNLSASELLAENLGRTKPEETERGASAPPIPTIAASPQATSIFQRLAALEQEGSSPPALYEVIERVIDLAAPRVQGDDYARLKREIESDD
jgi:hypothetical protein